MNKDYKPKGYNSVSPYLIVNGAEKLVDLFKTLFNAKEMRRYDMPDGSIMHIEIQIDDSIIMMGDASEEFPANKSLIHVYAADVDVIYENAIELGFKSIEPPKEKEGDPDRRCTFQDFSGNYWSVGMQKTNHK